MPRTANVNFNAVQEGCKFLTNYDVCTNGKNPQANRDCSCNPKNCPYVMGGGSCPYEAAAVAAPAPKKPLYNVLSVPKLFKVGDLVVVKGDVMKGYGVVKKVCNDPFAAGVDLSKWDKKQSFPQVSVHCASCNKQVRYNAEDLIAGKVTKR